MQREDLPVTRRGDLTDEQWNRIYPYLPVGRKGRPFDNVRDTVNGILRILRTGSPWRDLSPVYGISEGVYHHSRNMKVFFFGLAGGERVIQQPVIVLPILVFGTKQVDGGIQKFQHPVVPFNAFSVMLNTVACH